MKKLTKATTLVLVLCLVLSLAACGGGSSSGGRSSSMEGKYVISAMMIGDEDYLEMMRELAEMMGEEELNLEDFMYFEFSGTDAVTLGSDGDTETGTYKLDGNTLTITIDGEAQTATVNGNSFTLEYDEDGMQGSMTFTKK